MVLILKQDVFFVTPSHVLAKLYTNNLLMIFNSRLRIDHGRKGWPSGGPSFVSFAVPSTSLALVSSKVSNNVQTDDSALCQECRKMMLSSGDAEASIHTTYAVVRFDLNRPTYLDPRFVLLVVPVCHVASTCEGEKFYSESRVSSKLDDDFYNSPRNILSTR
jgi:hypothetical protein